MVFIKIPLLIKAEIKYLVDPTNISMHSIPSINTLIIFNSIVQFLRNLELYLFPIFILVNSGLFYVGPIVLVNFNFHLIKSTQ